VGAAVNILGTDLTGSTSFTFNGTAATFTVKSSFEITTTVPAGLGQRGGRGRITSLPQVGGLHHRYERAA